MSARSLRFRGFLNAHFALVFAALVLVTLAGGWTVYTTYSDPGVSSVEEPVSSWEYRSGFSHQAVVTADNSLYDVGSNLTNRSVYFARVSPRLEGAYRFSYLASESGTVDATVRLAVVMRGVSNVDGSENATVVWDRTRQLDYESVSTLERGEPVGVNFSANATALENRVRAIEASLGDPADQTELSLRARVRVSGTINGRAVDRIVTHQLPIVFEGGTYRVANQGPKSESFERTEIVTRERSYGAVRAAGGPLTLLLGLGGTSGLVLARRRDWLFLSDAERARLSYLDDREEFDEWISEIRLPAEAFQLPEAEAESLGALVDFAIDTNNGVAAAPEEDAFYVVHDGYLYAYRPPAVGEELSDEIGVPSSQLSLDEVGTDSRDVDAADDGFSAGMASDGVED